MQQQATEEYNMGDQQPTVVAQPDVDDPYFTGVAPGNAFVDPKECPGCLENLLDSLTGMYGPSRSDVGFTMGTSCAGLNVDSSGAAPNCAGAALQSAVELLKARGGTGQVLLFQTSLPTVGLGMLKNRDAIPFYTSTDEAGAAALSNEFAKMFHPQEKFYVEKNPGGVGKQLQIGMMGGVGEGA